jgi:hypothetical protein
MHGEGDGRRYIELRDLVPHIPGDKRDNGTIDRGYNGWRCGTIRGDFAPDEWIAIALSRTRDYRTNFLL